MSMSAPSSDPAPSAPSAPLESVFGGGSPEPAATPEPAEQAAPAAAPSTPASEPAPSADGALHPSWSKTLDEAGIPELLRPKLIEKIRADEAAVQRQIEAARGSVPPEWQSLLEDARTAGVTPEVLVNSYHALEQLRTDPIAFQQNLNAEIDVLVSTGKLTRAQGQEAKAEVAAATGQDDPEPLDGTAKELAELRAKIEQREQLEQEQLRQQEEAAQVQQLEQFYDQLLGASKAQLAANPAFAPVMAANDQGSINAQITVARLANSILESDENIAPQAAIDQAILQLAAVSGRQAPAAQAPAFPIQGGGAIPGAPRGKMTDEQRNQAMLDAARAAMAEE